jgi:2-keto-4-pentenoate hydratase/2-oxohepta-3-ene-1,7-dioic acid hydratase in catechol pathway
MKFARFEYDGKEFYGVVDVDELKVLDGSIFQDYEVTGRRHNISDVRLLPPVNPTKIVCIGLNYVEHIKELGVSVPEEPLYFLKPPSSLIGHEDFIAYPREAERVDYEGELAIVIKEKMKDVPEDEALSYVLGCSCFNDVTERSIQAKDPMLLTLAKGFDTFSAFGPYLVTGLDPNNLQVKTYLNGELMQNDSTKNCAFSVQYILHYLSRCLTLYPGDIVSTGTPKGIAPMKPGDLVEVEVEGVGRLCNTVKSAEAS